LYIKFIHLKLFMRKLFLPVICLLLSLLVIPKTTMAANDALVWENAYKAIVKIYTYNEDEYKYLSLAQTGSGVIVRSDGIFVTNEHVVTLRNQFDNELPVAYKVCLTESVDKEPDCSYSADLIAKDKDKDVAILKIRKIAVTAKDSFSYLIWSSDKRYKENDYVQAIGYPSSGGVTITGTGGTITGLLNKNLVDWIKTDALVSFGSSGGALVDTSGKLIGLTSAANSDVGYAISMSSLNDWVVSSIGSTPQMSSLQNRLNDFIIRQNNLTKIDVFNNVLPKISLTKQSNWEFFSEDENSFLTVDNEGQDGGFFFMEWYPTDTMAEPMLDIGVEVSELKTNCFSSGNVVVGGKSGRKMICPKDDGDQIFKYIVSSKNFMINGLYYYGKNKKDEAVVNTILKSLMISDEGNSFKEQRNYKHESAPKFDLSMPSGWSLIQLNSEKSLFSGQRSSSPKVSFLFDVEKLSEDMIRLSGQDYNKFIKNNDSEKNAIESNFFLKGVRYFENGDYKLNSSIAGVLFYKYKFKDESDGDKIKIYMADYRIRVGDKVVVAVFSYAGDDINVFEKELGDFEKNVLGNLHISGSTAKVVSSPTSQASANPVQARVVSGNLGRSLMGRIVLRVESNGEAWYVSPKTSKVHFLGRPEDAFQVMREQGVGIKNIDLEKIPVGLVGLAGEDSDEDGLPNMLEDAIGSDKNKKDTDGDGKGDKDELIANTSVTKIGVGRITDMSFANSQKGKIFIQVEGKGEAWYVNPVDGKRYFLGRPADAFGVMRFLGLGISNVNFEKL
jgi:hypothetical protein